jgi:uncharacterized protein (DUF1778 family)
MAKTRPERKPARSSASTLIVRMDKESKAFIVRAAQLQRISVSEYVRTITVSQARREVEAAKHQTIGLTSDEQSAFWRALQATPKLSRAQKRLGKVMRGEA